MISIVDYGAGNIASVRNMLKKLGHASEISADPASVLGAEKLILPGVGAFDHGMGKLNETGLTAALNEAVLENRTPILGICLGAQLLTRRSDEGQLPGLGWFEADTVAFDRSRLSPSDKVPHMGWTDVEVSRPHALLADLPEHPRFYFVHSFHLRCDEPEATIVTADHGYRFTAGIARDHIAGLQFHPEKSHKFGLGVLRNFAAL